MHWLRQLLVPIILGPNFASNFVAGLACHRGTETSRKTRKSCDIGDACVTEYVKYKESIFSDRSALGEVQGIGRLEFPTFELTDKEYVSRDCATAMMCHARGIMLNQCTALEKLDQITQNAFKHSLMTRQVLSSTPHFRITFAEFCCCDTAHFCNNLTHIHRASRRSNLTLFGARGASSAASGRSHMQQESRSWIVILLAVGILRFFICSSR